MPHITLFWTIEPASNPMYLLVIVYPIVLIRFNLNITYVRIILPIAAILAILSTFSPFYIRLSVIVISFSFGLSLVYSGTSWFFFSLVIMFLGGIIVVFVYASSLGRNFVIIFSTNRSYFIVVVIISIMLRFLFSNSYIVSINQSLVSIYNLQSFIFITILGSVLLGVLFVVSKVVTINDGTIKL